MPAYTWQALDSKGKTQNGTSEADSPSLLRQQLRAKDLIPLSVSEINHSKNNKIGLQGSLLSRVGKISVRDLSVITRQMATLLNSGLSIDSALITMVQQVDNSKSRHLLISIRSKITEGYTFAQSLEFFESTFPDYYISTVAAGEKSGKIGIVLDKLSSYLQTAHVTKNKVTIALIYPLIILVIGISVVIALLVFVVPKMTSMYTDRNQELPPITQVLISTSNFLQDWGGVLLGLFILLMIIFRISLKNQSFKLIWHKLLLRFPVYGRLLKDSSSARFIRTLSILLESKVDIVDSIKIASSIISILPIQKSLSKAGQKVQNGNSISNALMESGYFSPMLLSLVSSGEKSGSLAKMLSQGADSQEEDTQASIAILMSIFEPLMILIMGGMVLFIVGAVLFPISNMTEILAQ